jgi:hypothetical protein
MTQEFVEAVVLPAQLLLVRNEMVDRLVALLAEVDAVGHLFAGESLLEPLVTVQGVRDEVVEVVRLVRLAELAEHGGDLGAGGPREEV